ncbi:UDP-glucose/GDP-mannose dehydrogenase family protein [Helicobacter trogontum]|uniref:UDP-glucose dehydrogenase family protein n=2 Tax=Helicobacter trogontum TaxID=50960 RepID=UPI002A90BA7F|nr:UDP-glucose/GDP-mannose dehydrogenase family protein [Helicobacter trogontum]MDY5184983.1 UDP-glucose/GDP-mannose dehydrogenase family protein [Helicobacter trogontum]
MRITIIGSGYVGLVAGTCFAQMGNEVTCLDVDSKKIESLKQCKIPIYEPGLEEMVRENVRLNTLHFSTDKKEAISNAEVIFIAVGTPMGEDGSADLSFVKAVAQDIGEYMTHDYVVVVDKSTVPVGTARQVRKIIENTLIKRGKFVDNDNLACNNNPKDSESVINYWFAGYKPCLGEKKEDRDKKGWEWDKYNDNMMKNKKCIEEMKIGDKVLTYAFGQKKFDGVFTIIDSTEESFFLQHEHNLNLDMNDISPEIKQYCKESYNIFDKNGNANEGTYFKTNKKQFDALMTLNSMMTNSNHSENVSEKYELQEKSQNINFDVVSNPEFLKEGVAIKDFMSPDRVVIGTDSKRALEVMRALYTPFLLKSDRLIAMSIESAEMTKYAANAMLATKISFINEMSQICERVGANINDVRQGIGSDSRIGYSFIYPGCGYGGSCFPKDVRALEKSAKDVGYEAKILKAVQEVNEKQKMLLVEKILRHFGENLHGLSFCVWGLSFKPETDDMREASSLVLINELIKRGAKIQAYDPKAYEQARFYLKDKLDSIALMESKYSALQGCAALVLLTEWREFRSPDFDEIAKLLKEPIIFDGRNIYQHCGLEFKGFRYYQIGVGNL